MATPSPSPSAATVTRQTIICQDCELVGNIVVGEGSVLHPKCSLIAENPNGKIEIGENCIIEELVSIVHKRSGTLKIGNNNLFEVGCKIEGVKEIGDENVFEPKCELKGEITVGSGCTVSAATVVNGEMVISLLVAVSENNVIGKDGKLPWKLPKELSHFKKTTLGHHIIMGRKTFESIGRPLPHRKMIIVTRQKEYDPGFDTVKVTHSIDEALNYAKSNGEFECVVIGGSEIFLSCVDLATKLYFTRVHTVVEGDVFLPDLEIEKKWELVKEQFVVSDEDNPHSFTIFTYSRRRRG